jgi:NAD+ diphosphatase
MTSSWRHNSHQPRRQQTLQTVLAYSGSWLDRASARRADPQWIATLLASTGTRLIPLWQEKCLTSGAPPMPVTCHARAAHPVLEASDCTVFLGLDHDGQAVFGADLSALERSRATELAGADQALDVRSLVGALAPAEASVIAYARGLLHWNRNHRFCGTCGSMTSSRKGGHERVCDDQACARLHFPRIEPAVIMLVESREEPRRCLLARHRGSAPGGYSTLAGFVEIGESLEDAVRREVAEETGVDVGHVSYVASQAWPFPSGLMVAFRATAAAGATAEDVVVDGEEVVEARWFTRAELTEHGDSGARLGREDSIDRLLLRSWLDEGS